jgi:hypothetical protein
MHWDTSKFVNIYVHWNVATLNLTSFIDGGLFGDKCRYPAKMMV